MNNKKIVIFGANGFIGSSLKNHIYNNGLTNLITPDLRKETMKGEEFDIGFWCIGKTANFRQNTEDTLDAHVNILNRILLNNKFKKFVYISSTRVYQWADNTAPNLPLPVCVSSNEDLYNLSKLLGENLVIKNQSENALILRISNIVGPEEERRATFIGSVLRAIENKKLDLETTLDSAKDFLWIERAIKQIFDLSFSNAVGIHNVASGYNLTNEDWISVLQDKFDFELNLVEGAKRSIFPEILIEKSRNTANKFEPIQKVCESTKIRKRNERVR